MSTFDPLRTFSWSFTPAPKAGRLLIRELLFLKPWVAKPSRSLPAGARHLRRRVNSGAGEGNRPLRAFSLPRISRRLPPTTKSSSFFLRAARQKLQRLFRKWISDRPR